MPLIVQKFGGSSLASPEHIRRAAQRIRDEKLSGKDLVVVVSAMGTMTDELLSLARKTVKLPGKRELDMLLTTGERISMALLAMALEELGVPAISFTGSQVGIVTTDDHNEAKIIDIRAFRIQEALEVGKVVIVAGYQGVSEKKEITTLGRGGSDMTAIALAIALKADYCEILTDVDGIFTADPRIVPNAKLLETCSYDEALELASLGAKMQARSLELAKRYGMTVVVGASDSKASGGTSISAEPTQVPLEHSAVRGIATKKGYHYFKIESSAEDFLELANREKFPVRFLTLGRDFIEFLCEPESAPYLRNEVKSFGVEFEEIEEVSIVSAVGDGIGSYPNLVPILMRSIRKADARCLLISSNSLSITAAVPTHSLKTIAVELHQSLGISS